MRELHRVGTIIHLPVMSKWSFSHSYIHSLIHTCLFTSSLLNNHISIVLFVCTYVDMCLWYARQQCQMVQIR